jgi:hypothetical protein
MYKVQVLNLNAMEVKLKKDVIQVLFYVFLDSFNVLDENCDRDV